MKKYLALTAILGALAIFTPASAEAKTADAVSGTATLAASSGQVIQRRYNRRGVRIVTRTRTVRRGYRVYRETWQYRYQPNGRVTSRLIRRVVIR